MNDFKEFYLLSVEICDYGINLPGDFRSWESSETFAGPFYLSVQTGKTVSKFSIHNQKVHKGS